MSWHNIGIVNFFPCLLFLCLFICSFLKLTSKAIYNIDHILKLIYSSLIVISLNTLVRMEVQMA